MLIAYDTGRIKSKIEYIVQNIKDNIKDFPHSMEFQLDCQGPGVLIFLYTNVNLKTDMKFVPPSLNEINATVNINHFNPMNDGVYYCVANVSTYGKEQFLLINSGKYISSLI